MPQARMTQAEHRAAETKRRRDKLVATAKRTEALEQKLQHAATMIPAMVAELAKIRTEIDRALETEPPPADEADTPTPTDEKAGAFA